MNRRVLLAAGVVVALVIGIVAGTPGDPSTSTDDGTPDATVVAMAGEASDFSSTWYCAGGTAEAENPFALHTVALVNPTGAPMTATVTAFAGSLAPAVELEDGGAAEDDGATEDDAAADGSEDGAAADAADGSEATADTGQATVAEPVVHTVELAPLSRDRVDLRELLTDPAPVVSAVVEAPSGGLVVEHEVESVHGIDAKPCATNAATTWHFAWGDTSADARELLVVFNPFPDDAVLDGVFATEDTIRQPGRFDGLVVPGRSTLGIDLGDDVTRRDQVSATITARSGRVVIDRVQRINGEDRGVTVQTGVSVPQSAWVYADGVVGDTTREEFVVYNPSEELAEVDVTFHLDEPETNGAPDPIALSVDPGGFVRLDVNEDGRVPAGVVHTTTVASANGIPIVSERVLFGSGDTRRGITVTTGSPVEAAKWYFAAGAANGSNDEWMVIANLDPTVLARVDIAAIEDGQLVPLSELQDVEVAPGQRRTLRLGEAIQRDRLAIVVTSSEPVVVERRLFRPGGEDRGMSSSIGIPDRASARYPPSLDVADTVLAELDDLGDLEGAPTLDDDPNAPPTAPDDVELPEPDTTVVVGEDGETTGAPTTTSPTTVAPTSATTAAPPSG